MTGYHMQYIVRYSKSVTRSERGIQYIVLNVLSVLLGMSCIWLELEWSLYAVMSFTRYASLLH